MLLVALRFESRCRHRQFGSWHTGAAPGRRPPPGRWRRQAAVDADAAHGADPCPDAAPPHNAGDAAQKQQVLSQGAVK